MNTLQDQMFALVEEWQNSKMTKTEFAKQKDMSIHRFGYWFDKFHKTQKTNNSSKNASFFKLIEQDTKQAVASNAVDGNEKLRIDLPGGITLRIY